MKNIEKELDFEKRIRDIIQNDILPKNNSLVMLDIQKNTDILICKNSENPQLYFLEVKYYNKSHGRLGFGHNDGKGFQPEVLRKNPDYFKKNMRWVLGSMDSEDYFFVDNTQILLYISGKEIGYKQNNFQTKIFEEIQGLKKSAFCDELLEWINK